MSIYKRAVDKWGEDSQVEMAIEEMAELTLALQHGKRRRNTQQDIITEIADVTIMMRQLAVMWGQSRVDDEINRKLNRLIQRINGTEDARMA